LFSVAPIENLANTAKHLYLKDYRKYFKKNGVIEDRLIHGGAYTIFARKTKPSTIYLKKPGGC
jgi:hypothetical protein